jgi:hypothetical protein
MTVYNLFQLLDFIIQPLVFSRAGRQLGLQMIIFGLEFRIPLAQEVYAISLR